MRICGLVIALLELVVLGPAQAAQGPPKAPPPPEVAFIVVQPKTVPLSFDYLGVTEASKTVQVRSRVAGFLETREFEEGAFIKEGTTLFTIDPRPFKADLQIATAQVEQAQSELQLAQQELKRLQSVREPGAIAKSDIDKQLAQQATATATLQLSQANRDKAELELSYTTVKAPLTGLIGKALQDIGSYVDSAQNSLLAEMQQVDPIYVSFSVTEPEFLKWRDDVAKGIIVREEGTQPYVEITLLDGTTYGKHGTINFESPQVNVQTGTVEFRSVFDNPENRLKPGQYVKVHAKGWAQANTLTVPQRAVGQTPQGAYVYVIGPDDKAEMRPVTPGEWTGTDWIIDAGLHPGDRVVVEGMIKVQPGIAVRPKPYTEQAAPEKPAGAQP